MNFVKKHPFGSDSARGEWNGWTRFSPSRARLTVKYVRAVVGAQTNNKQSAHRPGQTGPGTGWQIEIKQKRAIIARAQKTIFPNG